MKTYRITILDSECKITSDKGVWIASFPLLLQAVKHCKDNLYTFEFSFKDIHHMDIILPVIMHIGVECVDNENRLYQAKPEFNFSQNIIDNL